MEKAGLITQQLAIASLVYPAFMCNFADMFLYNVTVGIDKDVELEWIQWMKQVHIPKIIATGMFGSFKMYKVLHDQSDESVSYSVQLFAETLLHVTTYFDKFAPALTAEHRARFRDKHVAFMTLLEEV